MVIAGPTASGKSALALALSRLTPITIINADASQVYRDLAVVTARPTTEEEAQAPHALYGHLDGAEACSAAEWAGQASEAVREAQEASRLPVLVGGTGLYLRTLLEGIAPVPEIDPGVRSQIRALSPQEASQALWAADPEAASRLNTNDRSRVSRALEVVRSTGKTLGQWQGERVGGIADRHDVTGIIILPPRDWLRDRCDARFEWMLENGAIAEVEALLARRLDVTLPVMRAIGVAEIAQFLADPSQRDAQFEKAKAATRQYAKRQYTWFRNQPPVEWQRIETHLNDDLINDLAIKCRDTALTS